MEQLLLIDEPRTDWQLDDHTREVGRKGLEEARAALAATPQRTATHQRTATQQRTAA